VGDPQRVTIQEAADRLGVKEDAIRKRIQRGTLVHEKTQEGRVFVWIDVTQDATRDATQDAAHGAPTNELVAELRDQVQFLREELARKDAILLRMAESIPQLEAPSEPREEPVSSGPSGPSPAGAEARTQPQSGPREQVSWWRRIWGG
jgi:hypothetical protein